MYDYTGRIKVADELTGSIEKRRLYAAVSPDLRVDFTATLHHNQILAMSVSVNPALYNTHMSVVTTTRQYNTVCTYVITYTVMW